VSNPTLYETLRVSSVLAEETLFGVRWSMLTTMLNTLWSMLTTKQMLDIFSDYRFWLGLIGCITGTVSLIFTYLGHRRANAAEIRLQLAERRAQEAETVRMRSARYLFGCEKAAAAAKSVENTEHPEWKQLSTSLDIGYWREEQFSVVFVDAPYQSNPNEFHDKTWATHWHKWYISIMEPMQPIDTYALFGELPHLLKRPGDLSFVVDEAVPAWVIKELAAPLTVGILYCKNDIY
jgi:hypothetical protein